ncbi:hypothetical protein LINGRAHAP2_LOCUS30772 [Linum grandiflorum]
MRMALSFGCVSATKVFCRCVFVVAA